MEETAKMLRRGVLWSTISEHNIFLSIREATTTFKIKPVDHCSSLIGTMWGGSVDLHLTSVMPFCTFQLMHVLLPQQHMASASQVLGHIDCGRASEGALDLCSFGRLSPMLRCDLLMVWMLCSHPYPSCDPPPMLCKPNRHTGAPSWTLVDSYFSLLSVPYKERVDTFYISLGREFPQE